jgi:hypothetical protein
MFLPIAEAFHAKYEPEGSTWKRCGPSASYPATSNETPKGRTPLCKHNEWALKTTRTACTASRINTSRYLQSLNLTETEASGNGRRTDIRLLPLPFRSFTSKSGHKPDDKPRFCGPTTHVKLVLRFDRSFLSPPEGAITQGDRLVAIYSGPST